MITGALNTHPLSLHETCLAFTAFVNAGQDGDGDSPPKEPVGWWAGDARSRTIVELCGRHPETRSFLLRISWHCQVPLKEYL